MRALAKELKGAGDGLDKAVKAELKEIAADIVPEARAETARAHPHAKTPKHAGEWKWASLVKGIGAGADAAGPFLRLNADKLPGAYGFAFGSNKKPQFPPRKKDGYFFFPAIDRAKPEAAERIDAVVTDYLQQLGGD